MRSRPTSRISIPKTSGSSRRSLTALIALATLAAAASAQQVTITGDVVHRTADGTTPVAGVWAVLHRITTAGGAPADSTRTGPRGQFQFRAVGDSQTVFLVSVRYGGIAYFTSPVHGFAAGTDSVGTIEVFDTTYGAPPIWIQQRHLIVSAAGERGREVVEFVELSNEGGTTRVADETGPPTWAGRVPGGIGEMNVGESDFSAEAVVRRGDSVFVYGPIPPGQRQLSLGYTVPSSRRDLEIVVDQPTGSLALLLEVPGTELVEGSLASLGTRTVEGRTFDAYQGRDLQPGTVLRIALTAGPTDWRWTVAAVVVVVGAALVFGVIVAKRRQPARIPSQTSDALAREIAALDDRYRGREGELEEAAWSGYLTRRRELKERLKAALAREGENT